MSIRKLRVFPHAPQEVCDYLINRPDYLTLPLGVMCIWDGTKTIEVEAHKKDGSLWEQYIQGLITGYLLTKQPEGSN